MKSESPSRSLMLPLVLVLAALAWRVAKLKFGVPDVLANFSPWMALAFAGSIVIPQRAPWWAFALVLLGIDAVCHPQDIAGMWLVYVCLGVAALLGAALRGKVSIFGVIGGTLACSIGFYLITSTQAWLVNPVYAKTFGGWLSAITVGDPVYQPQAWVFFVRSLLSDFAFCALLVLAYNTEAKVRELTPMPVAA